MEENPAFYRKFAELVQQAIDDYRQKRLSDAEYLAKVEQLMHTVRRGHEAELPPKLRKYREAAAYYGVLKEVLTPYQDADKEKLLLEMAIGLEEVINKREIRDWPTMEDVLKAMQNDIDDYLFDLEDSHGLVLQTSDMDAIIERCLAIARKLAGV